MSLSEIWYIKYEINYSNGNVKHVQLEAYLL